MARKTPLQHLAEATGVQTWYVDNTGNRRAASEESLGAVLRAMGLDAENPKDGLEWIESEKKKRLCEPVLVCWQKKTASVAKINLTSKGRVKLLLRTEDGRESELKHGPSKNGALRLPQIPTGYHKLIIESENDRTVVLLISAPPKLFAPGDGLFQWGTFLPLYAAHDRESWGAGSFSNWKQLGQWVASKGGGVMGTLPILSAFLDYPIVEASPYSPASRLFWNEFFIDITAVPEFQRSTAARKVAGSSPFKRKLRKFRASEYVHYAEEWALRRKVLEILAREFFNTESPRRRAFEKYLQTRPEVQQYAAFRAACDQSRTAWHNWPDSAKAGNLGPRFYRHQVRDFYLYIQWVAQSQMENVLSSFAADGMRFYLDLPLGVNPDGYDSWRYREFFAEGASAGAPPDSFFTKGQDWGFPPLHPKRCREQHYKYVIDYLAFQMRHTGMLRIDHVMGLHRLYWVPRGLPASAGAYVHYPAEELYAILSVESYRHKTMLVGENLGTVPPEVNKGMDRHGLRRMYVLQYEQRPKGPLPEPLRSVAAGLNTHDMPTFAAYWAGDDIADRADLGLFPREDIQQFQRLRQQLRKALIRFLSAKKLLGSAKPKTMDVLAAAVKFLAQSPAETVLINLEDLWLEKRPQNTPGTNKERINWRLKAKLSLEEIEANNQIAHILREINSARQKLRSRPRRKR